MNNGTKLSEAEEGDIRMKTPEERLYSYRQALRQLLAEAERVSSIEVTDDWIRERITRLTPASKEENPLDVLRDHFAAGQAFGYSWLGFPDILRAIELAREGKLKGVKVGF